MSKIKIIEWITGSIEKEVDICDIQKVFYDAIDNKEFEVSDNSIDLKSIFTEELICAGLEFQRDKLKEAKVLDLTFYYYEKILDYMDFIYYFIKNSYYDLSKVKLDSLDIDDWTVAEIDVE